MRPEMDGRDEDLKTVGKKEERMGAETETRNQLSARCVDRVLEMTSVTGRGTGSGRKARKSASGRGRRAGRGSGRHEAARGRERGRWRGGGGEGERGRGNGIWRAGE